MSGAYVSDLSLKELADLVYRAWISCTDDLSFKLILPTHLAVKAFTKMDRQELEQVISVIAYQKLKGNGFG